MPLPDPVKAHSKKAAAPVALFVYNRPLHTRKTVESLLQNAESKNTPLYIFSDGPKTSEAESAVHEVRELIKGIQGFARVTIIEQSVNKGLAQSIIDGITHVLSLHDSVIVMEDDLVTSPFFLQYMNEGLALYEHTPEVISLHAYCYPTKHPLPETFFLYEASCWGWATWRRGWAEFETDGAKLLRELRAAGLEQRFNYDGAYNFTGMLERQIAGKTNSWAIRWYASALVKHKLTLYPGRSLVRNIGFDDSGTHGSQTRRYDVDLASSPIHIRPIPLEESSAAYHQYIDYLKSLKPSFLDKLFQKLKQILGV